jgi:hypothetical protein
MFKVCFLLHCIQQSNLLLSLTYFAATSRGSKEDHGCRIPLDPNSQYVGQCDYGGSPCVYFKDLSVVDRPVTGPIMGVNSRFSCTTGI